MTQQMTHFALPGDAKTACGEPISGYTTATSAPLVSCGRCKGTRAFKFTKRDQRRVADALAANSTPN